MNDIIDRMGRAGDVAADVIDHIAPQQWDGPTPCEGWTVRTLATHLLGDIITFADAVTTRVVAEHPDVDVPDRAWSSTFRSAIARDLDAWGRPGAVEEPMTLSFGTVPGHLGATIHLTELVVHGIDLAVATAAEHLLDEELASALLAMMVAMGGMDAFRTPGMFGTERPADLQLPAHLRLLAYLGRPTAPSFDEERADRLTVAAPTTPQ